MAHYLVGDSTRAGRTPRHRAKGVSAVRIFQGAASARRASFIALSSARRRVTLLHHPGGDLSARAEPELGEDVLDVGVCRPLGDE
jgi:hypothetical protein